MDYEYDNNSIQFIEKINGTQRYLQPSGHNIFVVYVRSDDCGIVQDLEYSQRCPFVRSTDSCRDHVNIFDYITFVYCTIGASNEFVHWLVMVILLIFVFYMFSILGSTADIFLCPSLTVISTKLHMSENLAGVTILAFGNGSPDIFTSLANLERQTNLLIAEAYGAAVFVIGAISGAIIVIQPFKVYPPTYIRDVTFILFICIYVDYIMMDGTINLIESIFILFVYVLYLVVVVLDQFIVVRMSKDVQRKLDMVTIGAADDGLKQELQLLKEQGVLEVLGKKSHISLDIDETKSASFVGDTSNTNLFMQFFNSINPIDQEEWKDASCLRRVVALLKSPIVFILLLAIPVVDFEKQTHGWSKLLNTLQIALTPMLLLYITSYWDLKIKNTSILVYVAGTAAPLMILVFSTTRTDRPPVYHIVYAIGAMITCVVVIQIIASEVVMILDTVGIAAKLTPSFLGSTVLAWGNSVGDLMSNITFAKQGYHKMGFAACFGGPLIIIIVGFGITFVYKSATSPLKIAAVRQGSMGSTCNLFLIAIVITSMVGISLSKFQARSSIGILLLIIYLLFLMYTILGEFEIMHTYGTDHQEQRVTMD